MTSPQPAKPRFKHRLTRLGFHFLFVGAFAMLGGAVRGFNLLLVLAGLLVGALIMQWRWSRRSVEVLDVHRRLPTEAFAETPFRVRYPIRNRSRLMPAWMIRVEDRIESAGGSERAAAVCGVGVVSARHTVVPHYQCTIAKRGRYRFGPLSLMTSFPFALFTSRQIIDDCCELSVYPKLLTLRKNWQRGLTSRSGGMSTTARRSGPVEGEFFGLRDWQPGDSPKWIHWRTTARLSDLAVRQFEQQRRFDACVLVDAFQLDEDEGEAAELAISLAATFLVHLVGSPSNRMVLAVAGEHTDAVIGGGSREGKRRMLEMLASVRPTDEPDLDCAARKAIDIVGPAQDLIVISPRALELVQLLDPALTKTVGPWTRRGSFRWIDVTDPEMDRFVRERSIASAAPSEAPGTARTELTGVA